MLWKSGTCGCSGGAELAETSEDEGGLELRGSVVIPGLNGELDFPGLGSALLAMTRGQDSLGLGTALLAVA